jgi:hypothetical protein
MICDLKHRIIELNSEAMFLGDSPNDETFDKALMGYAQQAGGLIVALYDYDKVIDVYKAMGMNHADAQEFFDFNTGDAYVGKFTPMFFYGLES